MNRARGMRWLFAMRGYPDGRYLDLSRWLKHLRMLLMGSLGFLRILGVPSPARSSFSNILPLRSFLQTLGLR